jgi:uncharacterized protein (DUF433 family)
MSRVISLRLKDDDAKRIERLARRHSRSAGATASMLLREKLREEEFPFVEFRDSPIGRQAYIKGHRVTVWQVLLLAQDYAMEVQRVAEHLQFPIEWIASALEYAKAFSEEIEPIVEEVESMTFEHLRRKIPWVEEFRAKS